MDVIELARELGKAIQQDERFLAMQIATMMMNCNN